MICTVFTAQSPGNLLSDRDQNEGKTSKRHLEGLVDLEPKQEPFETVIKTFFANECYLDQSKVERSTSLFNSGLLQSIDFIDLIAFLEQTYAISIPTEELDVENFDTLDIMENFVKSKGAQLP